MNSKELLYFSVCIFLCILAWVVADVYHAGEEKKHADSMQVAEIKQIVIDDKLLLKLQQKEQP